MTPADQLMYDVVLSDWGQYLIAIAVIWFLISNCTKHDPK